MLPPTAGCPCTLGHQEFATSPNKIKDVTPAEFVILRWARDTSRGYLYRFVWLLNCRDTLDGAVLGFLGAIRPRLKREKCAVPPAVQRPEVDAV